MRPRWHTKTKLLNNYELQLMYVSFTKQTKKNTDKTMYTKIPKWLSPKHAKLIPIPTQYLENAYKTQIERPYGLPLDKSKTGQSQFHSIAVESFMIFCDVSSENPLTTAEAFSRENAFEIVTHKLKSSSIQIAGRQMSATQKHFQRFNVH